MKTIIKTAVALLLIALTTSCTLQKRQYSNGYYVSWNKSHVKQKGESKIASAEAPKVFLPTAPQQIVESPEILAVVSTIDQPQVKFKKGSSKIITETPVRRKYFKLPKIKFDNLPTPLKQYSANVSLTFGIISALAFFGSLVTAFFAITYAVHQLQNIKRDPLNYGGKTKAIFGLILGILSVLIFIVFIAIL